jgi:hypothetical protein
MIAPNTFAHFLAGWLVLAAACAAQATAQSLHYLHDSVDGTGHVKGDGAVSSALLAAETDQAVPVVETIIPVPGRTLRELYSIEVQFNEPVAGVDVGDLIVNGTAATNMIQIAPSDFLFTFPQPLDGLVRVEWSVNHGITDHAEPAHPFSGGSWTYTLDSTLPAPSLFISEFMADNKNTMNDEDGDSSDWIEIANSDSEPASLTGWYLTDDPTNPTKWAFPEVDVPARGFIVVFASGKNRAGASGKLHTNFKLASTGGYLALVDPRTNVVSDFAPAYPRQFTDVSYGRVPGEMETIGYFTKPTPGAQNASGGPGFAPAVEFSMPSCTFTTPFELELRTSLPDAVIRYTLDGNLPTNSSPAYAGPLLITNSVQVRPCVPTGFAARPSIERKLRGTAHKCRRVQFRSACHRFAHSWQRDAQCNPLDVRSHVGFRACRRTDQSDQQTRIDQSSRHSNPRLEHGRHGQVFLQTRGMG